MTINKEIIMSAVRRLVRNFISTFIVTFILFFEGFKSWELVGTACRINAEKCLESFWAVAMLPALIAGLTAGMTALGKLIRELLRENGMEDWAKKVLF